ncbi:MAG: CoA pyrophosphatase [Pseudomonadota bacterium]
MSGGTARLTMAEVQAAVWSVCAPDGRGDHDPDGRAGLDADEIRALAAADPGGASRLTPAAVLCPIVPRADGLHVLLTQRAAHLKRHAGQIAFPGGKVDPEDRSPMAAALREADEEIGLRPEQADVMGPIETYVTGTGYRITPFVAAVDPYFRPLPQDAEVADVFEVPLDFLMDPANHQRRTGEWRGRTRRYYAMPYGERFIWGATAGILKALADRVAGARAATAG